jgi:hypothetical protein
MNRLLRLWVFSACVALAPSVAACKQTAKVVNTTNPNVVSTPTDDDPRLKAPSEIQLVRINSGCIDCDDHSLTLRRAAGDIFADASVIRTDLHTKKQREGKLSAYYYNHLIELFESQGVMEMDDQYAMGWEDALVVKMTVSIGDRHKTIRTANEGEVPLKLWGWYMAIDGAAARTKWNDSK